MKVESELIELRLVTSTQTEINSELIELRLVTSTQTEINSELIELRIVMSTQMVIGSELNELRIVALVCVSDNHLSKRITKKIKHLLCDSFIFTPSLPSNFVSWF